MIANFIDVILLGGPMDGAQMRTLDGQDVLDVNFHRPGQLAEISPYHRGTQRHDGLWQYVWRYPRKHKPAPTA